MKTPKIALVADWLTVYGGAESVIERLLHIFPEAPLFTTVFVPDAFPLEWESRVKASFLQRLPLFLRKKHPFLLPFLPPAIEQLDLRGYDIVISSSSFVGKGVLTTEDQLHICYCHAPTRYLWGDWQSYVRDFPIPQWIKSFLPKRLSCLREWDRIAAKRPDIFLANSEYIQKSIQKYYKRSSEVLVPPVQSERFAKGILEKKEDFYLFLGRLVPQKRVDLLIQAFRKMPSKKLIIAGEGRMKNQLQEMALGCANITFLGFVPDTEVPSLLGRAKALLFPQLEDAGITALEAVAAGTPVIAFGKGGVLTTLEEGKNALFFLEQNPESLLAAIEKFEDVSFSRSDIQEGVKKYDQKVFDEKMQNFVLEKWKNRHPSLCGR